MNKHFFFIWYSPDPLSCGVTQGSILGPLMWGGTSITSRLSDLPSDVTLLSWCRENRNRQNALEIIVFFFNKQCHPPFLSTWWNVNQGPLKIIILLAAFNTGFQTDIKMPIQFKSTAFSKKTGQKGTGLCLGCRFRQEKKNTEISNWNSFVSLFLKYLLFVMMTTYNSLVHYSI